MWKDLIICNTPKYPGVECGINQLVILTQNLITNLVIISTFLATAAFVYAGFILLTSGGSEGKKDEAKKIFTKVMIGYLWILGAWLVVYTITSVLLKTGYSLLGK